MEASDRREFTTHLANAWTLYGKPLTPGTLDIFWHGLKPYAFEAVKRALNLHIVDPDRGQYAPKPADLIRLIEGDTETQALRAWGKALDGLKRAGVYASVVFDDPLIHTVITDMGGWVGLGQMKTADETYRGHEFARRYRGYLAQRALPAYPERLKGLIEKQNAAAGYDEGIPEPILLGDPAKARRVLAGTVPGAIADHRPRARPDPVDGHQETPGPVRARYEPAQERASNGAK